MLRYVFQTPGWTGSKTLTALNLSLFWEQVAPFCGLSAFALCPLLGMHSLCSVQPGKLCPSSYQLKCQGCSKAILNSSPHPCRLLGSPELGLCVSVLRCVHCVLMICLWASSDSPRVSTAVSTVSVTYFMLTGVLFCFFQV